MEWQPINTAPKDGSTILFWQKGKTIKKGLWIESREWCLIGWKCGNGNFHEPTHWMPLPDPPAYNDGKGVG